ncbi:MAG: hypothetical protein GF364_06985 [Candidatus Lokiarchaeota archaeon]|nr:hypothetical protein [Candidatus Lokiarchaeota archaeon]
MNSRDFFIFPENIDIFVFDATPLLSGIDIGIFNELCYTTSEIIDEIKRPVISNKIDNFILNRSLSIVEVPNSFIKKIQQLARKSGDLKSLSQGDISVLGCGLYLNASYRKQFGVGNKNHAAVYLVSDDYSIQNVARLAHINTKSFKKKGIKQFIRWQSYCPNCHKEYIPEFFGSKCPNCSAIIKRRPKK